jgi:uncharacterized membrane protein YgcG
MRFLILAAAAAALLIGGAAATLAISGNSLALAGGSTTGTLPSVAPARTTEDVSGPCDEAEHANDARCAGTTTTTTTPAAKATRREDRAGHRHRGRHGRGGESRAVPSSGPSADDNRGRGSDDGSGHDGGNSGRGSDDGGGDNSGHGGGGRDHPEDD